MYFYIIKLQIVILMDKQLSDIDTKDVIGAFPGEDGNAHRPYTYTFGIIIDPTLTLQILT